MVKIPIDVRHMFCGILRRLVYKFLKFWLGPTNSELIKFGQLAIRENEKSFSELMLDASKNQQQMEMFY